MPTYVAISEEDLVTFLKEHDFLEIDTKYPERVFAKVDYCGKMPINLQIYTSLTKRQHVVRKVGEDAIRFLIKGRSADGVEYLLNKPKRFYRTKNWRATLNKHFNQWEDFIKYRCYTCNSPLTYISPESKKMQCTFCR